MPINTYVELDRITLTSNGGPVTFTNIPQTYTDLRIVIRGGFVDSGFMIGARVGNGSVDTAGNYSYNILRGNGSTATGYKKNNMVFGAFCQQGGNNLNNVITVDFLNYSNTTTHKSWISRYGNAGEGTDLGSSLWRSTAAINIISIAECGDGGTGAWNYGNMLSGTTFSLYGIKAWAPEATPKATGGYVYSDTNYWYHAFPFSSTFTPTQSLTADVLVVAGGGGGGNGNGGGGGGAGGVLGLTSQSLTTTNYTVTIGAGGAMQADGVNSVFGSSTALKGGRGGDSGQNGTGGSGTYGSGGGCGRDGGQFGGAGTSGQGFAAGNSAYPAPTANGGSGGGGAGGAGKNVVTSDNENAISPNGDGGIGVNTYSSWLSATRFGVDGYIAGGGGGSGYQVFRAPVGGLGGGGRGTMREYGALGATAGVQSTGSGGGGGGTGAFKSNGMPGGSGLVIVRYAK